jgi:excinuclease UvrABC ATPase subunit
MTICGQAGSGKTVLILNTLVTVITNLFPTEQCSPACAPTGYSAFNAGGVTRHKLFSI